MSCTQLAFNSGDLAFQEIITSRPYRDSDRPIAPLLPVCADHLGVTWPQTRLSVLTCGPAIHFRMPWRRGNASTRRSSQKQISMSENPSVIVPTTMSRLAVAEPVLLLAD